MRISVRGGLGLACLVALATVGSARAVDEPIPGKIHIVKPNILAKMVAKPPTGTTFPLPAGDPTVDGGSIEIFDTVGGGSPPMVAALPSAGWKALGNPPGSKGYKYKGAGTPADPCKVGLVKEKVIKFVCKGTGVTLVPPFQGNSGIIFTVSAGTPTRYCAEFGGTTVKNVVGLLKRKDALPPGACPVAGTTTTSTSSTSTSSTSSTSTSETTTTSTSSTSSTSSSSTSTSSTSTSTSSSSTSTSSSSTSTSSTTSTTAPPTCCNSATALRFTNADLPGDCGDIIDAMLGPVANIECSGLYTGGGGNSVPLPFAVPDMATSITTITSCIGQTATLGGTTSSDTGSNRTCTSAGCLFGAPLAVPNPGSTPTSVCVLNSVSGSPSGTGECDTGATSLVLPLESVLFLTGDTATDPSDTITGIQPCPICRDPGGGFICTGGTNNGSACTPGTGPLDDGYPTSHDCPPDPMFNIGTLPVNFSLSTGTLTWSGTVATNDTGSTASVQNRVFSGYCRDAEGSGAFAGTSPATAEHCWENGMAVGPACSGTFQSCEQRNNGAFGPSGGANRTIVAIGNAMSVLGGPAPATLVSIFSIAPTFDATVDAAGDLPGPGAVALPGTASLCATPSPCP